MERTTSTSTGPPEPARPASSSLRSASTDDQASNPSQSTISAAVTETAGSLIQDLSIARVMPIDSMRADQGEDAVANGDILRIVVQLIPAPVLARDIDGQDVAEPSRSGREHRHAIGEKHPFLDAVGHEQYGDLAGGADPQQLLLQRHPSLRV